MEPEGEIPKIVIELRDSILDAFEFRENDFIEALYPKQDLYDYTSEVKGESFKERAMFTVRCYKSLAGLSGLLMLAGLVKQARPLRDEFPQIIERLEALKAGSAAGKTVETPGPSRGVVEELPLAVKIAVEISERNQSNLHLLADEIRPVVRALVLDPACVADEFHLSSSPWRRLAAVLALERFPRKEYLHWLAERTVIEAPVAAFYASQALAVTAFKFADSELDHVRESIRQAARLLDTSQDTDQAALLASRIPVDIAARKRLLLSAEDILDFRCSPMESPHSLKADEFKQFAEAVVADMTPGRLDEILAKIKMQRLVNPADPAELNICRVFLTARANGWEARFVATVGQAMDGNPKFQFPFLQRFRDSAA